jgi:hypothetical protein
MKTDEMTSWVEKFFAADDSLLAKLGARAPDGPRAGQLADPRLESVETATAKGAERPYRLSVRFAGSQKLRWDEIVARFGADPTCVGPDRDAWGGPDAWIFKIRGRRHEGIMLLMVDDLDREVDFHGFHLQRYPEPKKDEGSHDVAAREARR